MRLSMRNGLHVAAAITAFCLAGFAVIVADATKVLICEGDSGTTCPTSLMTTQLVVAIAGLVPAGALLFAVIANHRRLAQAALVVAPLTYAGWGVLNDVAVHGW